MATVYKAHRSLMSERIEVDETTAILTEKQARLKNRMRAWQYRMTVPREEVHLSRREALRAFIEERQVAINGLLEQVAEERACIETAEEMLREQD